MRRIGVVLILSLAVSLFFSCNGSDPEPEEPEYVEPACVMAEAIELPRFLGCQADELPGVEKNELHRLVLEDHPLYDTVYTRLLVDHIVVGPTRFAVHVDSAANLNLLCNALGSIDYPQLWVTALGSDNCQ